MRTILTECRPVLLIQLIDIEAAKSNAQKRVAKSMCRHEIIGVVAAFMFVLWITSAFSQRWNQYAPRVPIPWLIAVLSGSKNEMVMWRTFTLQVGIVIYMICYTIQILTWCVQNLLPPGIIAGLVIFILQRQYQD
jgi:hypothetical protein